jgi:hypothetical protein
MLSSLTNVSSRPQAPLIDEINLPRRRRGQTLATFA